MGNKAKKLTRTDFIIDSTDMDPDVRDNLCRRCQNANCSIYTEIVMMEQMHEGLDIHVRKCPNYKGD
jgi:hypothetical protein